MSVIRQEVLKEIRRKPSRDWPPFAATDLLNTFDRLLGLIRRAGIYCKTPGGRFGEDPCGVCGACQLDRLYRQLTG